MSNVVPFRKHCAADDVVSGLRDLADRIERGETQANGCAVFVQQNPDGDCVAYRYGTTFSLSLIGAALTIAQDWARDS